MLHDIGEKSINVDRGFCWWPPDNLESQTSRRHSTITVMLVLQVPPPTPAMIHGIKRKTSIHHTIRTPKFQIGSDVTRGYQECLKKETTHRRSRHSSNPVAAGGAACSVRERHKGSSAQSDQIHLHPYRDMCIVPYLMDGSTCGEDVGCGGCQGHGMDEESVNLGAACGKYPHAAHHMGASTHEVD